jgi:CRP-like cAMP-binding protein
MVPHPAEIAEEIKSYTFFRSFEDSLLLQAATMIRPIQFSAGETLIKAQQFNNRLFFLRSGILEVLVDNEKVGEIKSHGEVLGEMSVLSGAKASADIRAQTSASCFYIEADDFQHVHPNQKDRFQHLLYKIYANVLTERLLRTNEKAKLYEITARELALKKRELEMISLAQLNFFRADAKPSTRSVICLDANKKNHSFLKTAIASAGMNYQLLEIEEDIQKALTQSMPEIIVADESYIDFLAKFLPDSHNSEIIILADSQLKFDNLKKAIFADTIITRNPADKASNIKSLLTAFTKILHHTYFGAEKYLSIGTELKTLRVTASKDREPLKEKMLSDLKSLGVRSSQLDRIQLVAEEMLMNAIYDAPIGTDGKSLFNHLPRTEEIVLSLNQHSDLRWGFDGNIVAISVTDPFGSLSKDLVLRYLESCYQNHAGSMNAGKGGAGRGLHQILESSDWTIFNIEKWAATEVICLFEVDKKEDTPPQFQVFIVN